MLWWFKNLHGFRKVSTKLLYAQTYHETGNFTSKVFKENKNLFGMRQPKKRQTLATGTQHSHATFQSYKDSIVDYFYRQKEFNISNVDDGEYMLATVKSRYAEDSKYMEKWQAIKDKIKFPINNNFLYAIGLFFLVLISFLMFLIIRTSRSNYKTLKKYK